MDLNSQGYSCHSGGSILPPLQGKGQAQNITKFPLKLDLWKVTARRNCIFLTKQIYFKWMVCKCQVEVFQSWELPELMLPVYSALYLQGLCRSYCLVSCFLNLSNLTLKIWLANMAFSIQGNPTLHTFSSMFTQLLFDVLFAFCCASSKGHWNNVPRVICSPTESTVLASSLFLLWAVRSVHDSQDQRKTLPSWVRPWVYSGHSKVSLGGSVP